MCATIPFNAVTKCMAASQLFNNPVKHHCEMFATFHLMPTTKWTSQKSVFMCNSLLHFISSLHESEQQINQLSCMLVCYIFTSTTKWMPQKSLFSRNSLLHFISLLHQSEQQRNQLSFVLVGFIFISTTMWTAQESVFSHNSLLHFILLPHQSEWHRSQRFHLLVCYISSHCHTKVKGTEVSCLAR